MKCPKLHYDPLTLTVIFKELKKIYQGRNFRRKTDPTDVVKRYPKKVQNYLKNYHNEMANIEVNVYGNRRKTAHYLSKKNKRKTKGFFFQRQSSISDQSFSL